MRGLARAVALVVSVALLVVPAGGCARGVPADAQDSPENLLVTLLELREADRTHDADRFFITGLRGEDWDNLDTVGEEVLCSADGADCDDKDTNNTYWQYVNNRKCEGTSAEEVRERGVEFDQAEAGDPVVVEVVGTRHEPGGHLCAITMRQVDGKWWVPA